MQTHLCNGKYKYFSSYFVTSIIDKRVILRGDFKGNAHQFWIVKSQSCVAIAKIDHTLRFLERKSYICKKLGAEYHRISIQRIYCLVYRKNSYLIFRIYSNFIVDQVQNWLFSILRNIRCQSMGFLFPFDILNCYPFCKKRIIWEFDRP